MNMLITQGLGSAGDGSGSGLLTTGGLGSTGTPDNPACLALQVLAVENFGGFLLIIFSAELVVSGPGLDPSSYTFTGPTALTATDVSVQVPGHILKVSTIEQQTGGDYTITLPTQGIHDIFGNLLDGPFTTHFTGIGIPVVVQIAKSFDERTLDVVFSKAVLEADAIQVANYSVSSGVVVFKSERITDFYYRLTTSPLNINQSYTVDISNIRDSNGNL